MKGAFECEPSLEVGYSEFINLQSNAIFDLWGHKKLFTFRLFGERVLNGIVPTIFKGLSVKFFTVKFFTVARLMLSSTRNRSVEFNFQFRGSGPISKNFENED